MFQSINCRVRLLGVGLGAGLLASAMSVGPVLSAHTIPMGNPDITIRVPVKLKTMIAHWIEVRCTVYSTNIPTPVFQSRLGQGVAGYTLISEAHNLDYAELDWVFEVKINPDAGKSLVTARSYECQLFLKEKAGGETYPAEQVLLPSIPPKVWEAKSGEFFRGYVSGPIKPKPSVDPSALKPEIIKLSK